MDAGRLFPRVLRSKGVRSRDSRRAEICMCAWVRRSLIDDAGLRLFAMLLGPSYGLFVLNSPRPRGHLLVYSQYEPLM